jgi:putative spermidine/putrescine transport system ATP-binding protein/spermidine/putrescine transport system ATP-binding protein
LNSAAERRPSGTAAADDRRDLAVQVNGVTRRFGRTVALDGISLGVRRGELMTLLGPSGCGKTTLLNLIAGFLDPDRGEIVVDGESMADRPTYRREIGIMFQSYALFPHMSVAANIGYGLKMRRLRRSEIAQRVAEALALVKLEGLEDRRPSQLSGGQQQRVALARAVVIRPKVLLLDEPFSALDRNLRASMQVEIKEIQRRLGVTTIFVTHDQSEALSLSDRIAVMAEGRIRQLGAPDEIYRRPADRFVASFVGDVNVLRGHIESVGPDAATIAVGSIKATARTLGGPQAGAGVDLFVRPEDLRVCEPNAPGALAGVVATQVFQGGHVDLYVSVAQARSGRVLIRVPGHQALSQWPAGARVGVMITSDAATAFPAAPPEGIA